MTGLHPSTGFPGWVRRRAASKLAEKFLPYVRQLLATSPILHADETTGRSPRTLACVHVVCTEYSTVMHVGG